LLERNAEDCGQLPTCKERARNCLVRTRQS
jgi:hypothetical protein